MTADDEAGGARARIIADHVAQLLDAVAADEVTVITGLLIATADRIAALCRSHETAQEGAVAAAMQLGALVAAKVGEKLA